MTKIGSTDNGHVEGSRNKRGRKKGKRKKKIKKPLEKVKAMKSKNNKRRTDRIKM